MVNLDTVKIQFHRDLALNYNSDYFRYKTEETDDNYVITSHKLRKPYKRTGLKDIVINENNVIIDFGSKLLPGRYKEMINLNTMEEYLKEITLTGLINFNTNDIISQSSILSCDVTNNMTVESVPEYVNSLMIFKLNDKYTLEYYPNQTLIFTRDVKTKSVKERLELYNKYDELFLKRNEKFRDKINVDEYKNILRIESRFENHELMRQSFKTDDQNFLSILSSKEKINYNIWNRITKSKDMNIETFTNNQTLMKMKEKLPYYKIRNLRGDIGIIQDCNHDIDLIKRFFKTNSTANNSARIKYLSNLSLALQKSESNNNVDDKVNEIKQFLKVA
jgi:hypothetical protein